MPRVKRTEMRVPDRIDVFVETLNKQMRGVGRIDRGRDISWIDPPRLRTGILGLDVVSRGGLPRGGLVQFWGAFSSGKTTTALHVMAAEQRAGKPVMYAAGEGFNKEWARRNGLWIPYSEEDHAMCAEDQRDAMEEYDAAGVELGYGTVAVVQHVHGDGLLEATARALKANLFSVIVVDSLASLRNTRQIEDAEVGDEEMGGGGQVTMFNRFMGRAYSALNTKYDLENNIDMEGEVGNQTCLVCINQARVKFGARTNPGAPTPMRPPGGEGLRHAWHLSVQFSAGAELGEREGLDGRQNWTPWGTEIRARSDKSKIGPKGRSAAWELYTEDHEPFTAGSIDHAKEARIWGVYYGVIEQAGAWYVMPDGSRINGKEEVDRALASDDELRQNVEAQVVEACKR